MGVQQQGGSGRGPNRPGGHRFGADPPRATIVVLDDDLVFRRGLSRVLRSEGYDVIEVEDIQGLEAALVDGLVDLVVADSRLADGSDGWQAARALAKRHGEVPVLAISGYDRSAIAAVGGVTDIEYVRKAGAGFNIVAAVEQALE